MTIRHALARLAGKALSPIHAGDEKLATNQDETRAPDILRVGSEAFHEGDAIPPQYAGEDGVAPELRWDGVPAAAKEIVVLCEDPDAPMMEPFVHWSMYGIPPSTHEIPEGSTPAKGIPGGALQGKNSVGKDGFTGPKPPPGHGLHHYHFQVFALDAPLGLLPGADRDAIVDCDDGARARDGRDDRDLRSAVSSGFEHFERRPPGAEAQKSKLRRSGVSSMGGRSAA